MSTSVPIDTTIDQSRSRPARDLFALTKPSIVLMTLLTAGWGLGLAPSSPAWTVVLACLLGTALSVGSANAFNMWIERDIDKLMTRTRLRPLPDGRMHPTVALVFACVTGAGSIAVLALWVNWLTTVLSTLALVLYVAAYTPMKRLTTLALPVGAVAGAMPPLLGWTAATGNLTAPGLLLFGILFVWQLPHFLAISMFRKHEYERAGILTVPGVHGENIAARLIAATTVGMLVVSTSLAFTDTVGGVYLAWSGAIGAGICALSFKGLRKGRAARDARTYFFATLGYLPAIAAGMLVDSWF